MPRCSKRSNFERTRTKCFALVTGRGGLDSTFDSVGALCKAIKCHSQDLAITKEVGDRAGEEEAYDNLRMDS